MISILVVNEDVTKTAGGITPPHVIDYFFFFFLVVFFFFFLVVFFFFLVLEPHLGISTSFY
jgi:hypothetical protein